MNGAPVEHTKSANLALGRFCVLFTVLASAVFVVLSLVRVIVLDYGAVPEWDQWEEVVLGDYISRFFAQHNEHRIVLARLFFIVDAEIFDGLNIFNLAASFMLQLLHAALLLGLAFLAGVRKRYDFLLLAGLLFVFLFSIAQVDNFVWGFQIQFISVFFFASMAFAVLACWGQNTAGLLSAVVLSFCAVGSMANGLLAPWALLVLGCCLHLSRSKLAVLTASAVAISCLYMWGYDSPGGGHSGPLQALTHPIALFEFVARYLGSPFAGLVQLRDPWRSRLGMSIGVAGLLLMLRLNLIVFARRSAPVTDQAYRAQVALLFIMLFVVGSALVTGMGRLWLTPWASRYATPALIFFASGFLLFWVVGNRSRVFGGKLATISIVVICVTFVTAQIVSFVFTPRLGIVRQEAAAALLSHITSPDWLARSYPDPTFLLKQTEKLRAARLSVFRDSWAQWWQQPLSKHAEVSAGTCAGKLDRILRINTETDYLIEGWAHFPEREKRIVFVNGRDEVVGYGFGGYDHLVDGKAYPPSEKASAFRGFVHSRTDENLRAYVVGTGRACALASGVKTSEALFLSGSLGVASPVSDGRFDPSSIPGVSLVPFKGMHLSSYGASGVTTLYWKSDPLPRDAAGIVLPLWANRSDKALSLKVIEPVSGTVLLDIMPRASVTWRFLPVPVPAHLRGQALEILAVDEGGVLGSWLAVGQPQLLFP